MGKFYEALVDELTLYVQHSAWLNATPARAEGDSTKAPQLSRLAQLRKDHADDSWEPEMPPAEGAAYLLGYLYELGPTVAAGMGAGPVTHTEIVAWCQLTGIDLEPWEARAVRRLSIDYLIAMHDGSKYNAPPPWQAPGSKPPPTALQLRLRALARL